MQPVLNALQKAARDLFTARMLALSLWPMGLALLVWGALAWAFGAAWKAELAAWLAATPLADMAQWAGVEWLLAYAALFVLVLLWLPAVYLTALLITSVVFMPAIVDHVAGRHYPGLEVRKGGSLAGGLANGLWALLLYLAGWAVLLPLWLLLPFGMAVSLLLNAWLNQRLFLYDALAEHADAGELAAMRLEGGWPRYLLGALLGLLHLVPVLNFLAPVYMGLAFAHYGLDSLQRKRTIALP